MVDDATQFSATQFVKPLITKSFKKIILTFWAIVYTGQPNTLDFDDGTQFRDTFVEICEIHDVEAQRSGTQHHSALSTEERNHEPIKPIFRKVRINLPKLNKKQLLN